MVSNQSGTSMIEYALLLSLLLLVATPAISNVGGNARETFLTVNKPMNDAPNADTRTGGVAGRGEELNESAAEDPFEFEPIEIGAAASLSFPGGAGASAKPKATKSTEQNGTSSSASSPLWETLLAANYIAERYIALSKLSFAQKNEIKSEYQSICGSGVNKTSFCSNWAILGSQSGEI